MVQEMVSRVAFNYVFPSEFEDDKVFQFKNYDGPLPKSKLGTYFIDSTDAALLRYHNRSNFCYTTQSWNFTQEDRKINQNCSLITSGIHTLLQRRTKML